MGHNPAHDALRFAVTDYIWDKIADDGTELTDEFWDWYADNIEQPLLELICEVDGHDPYADMCNKPEHDHCGICMTPMPGQAPHRLKLLTSPDQ